MKPTIRPTSTPLKVDAPPCRATVVAQPDGLYRVQFDLVNATDVDVELPSYAPFVQFQLRAEAGGAAISVEQPTLDLGLQEVTLRLPARENLTLTTPVRLHLGAAAPPPQDRFVWSIDHEPAGLTLEFTLDLPAPYGGPCRTAPEGAR